MSFICPPKHLPLWKEMVDKYGEDGAMLAFLRNSLNIPDSMEHADLLISKNKSTMKDLKDIKEGLLDSLTIQKKIYERRIGGKKYVEEISDIIDKLKNNESIAAIIEMIGVANKYTAESLTRIKVLQEKVNLGLDKLSDSENQEIADTMNEVKQFLSAYTILEDAEFLFDQDTEHFKQLNLAMRNRREIVSMYRNIQEEILSNMLAKQADRVNQGLKATGVDYKITKDDIKSLLHSAASDISVWEQMLGAQANSKDPLTGLVASWIKEKAYQQHLEDYRIQQELASAYHKSDRDKSSINTFNSKYIRQGLFYEEVPILDENGKQIIHNGEPLTKKTYVKHACIHTEYLEDEFQKAQRDERERLKKEGIDGFLAYRAMQAWYNNNTVLQDINKLESEKKVNLSLIEFKRWKESNLKRVTIQTYQDGSTTLDYIPQDRIAKQTGEHVYLYTGDYLRPIDAFKNKQWNELQKDEYFVKLHETYQNANDKQHGAHQLEFGRLPQVRKEGLKGKLREDGIKLSDVGKAVKESVNVDAYDSAYGIQKPDGSVYKEIPHLFTQTIPDEDLSMDLYQSVLLYSQASNRFKTMSDIQPYIELLTDSIKGNPDMKINARNVINTTSIGGTIINAVLAKPTTKPGTRVNEALLEFIDKIVYDEREVASSINIMGKDVSLNKLSGKLLSYSSITSLAFNLATGVNNEIFGQYQTALESAVGEYFSKSDYLAAQKEYMGAIGDFIGDISAGYPRSKWGRIAAQYDAMQGEHSDSYGKEVTKNGFSKLFSTSTLFFLQKSGEHHIQMSALIAMMRNTKVKTKDGGEITLADAYDSEGNLKSNVLWTKDDQFNFMQRLHGLNKKLHGIHNKFDSPTIQRKWYGKLIMLFRKHIYTGVERRWSKKYIDIESASQYEGYYRTFFGKLASEIKEHKFDLLLGRNLTPAEKRARFRTYTDLVVLAGTYILFSALKAAAGDDDEENSWLCNQSILQSRRLSGDIMFYISPTEFIKLTRTPSAVYGTLDNITNLFGQLADPFAQYERDTYAEEKGNYKIVHKLKKVVPVFSGISKSLDPAAQVQFYNSFY